MSTTSLTAGEVMDRSAALMNDPEKTDYTYEAQLPYLNMAIDELVELLEESNNSPTNKTSEPITLAVGEVMITPAENPTTPHYPEDLIEIQEVRERDADSDDDFVLMTRKEFISATPATNSLLAWSWEDQCIKFNPNGANTIREIQIRYVGLGIAQATDENSVIGTIGARSFLAFKTAALCSMFIGENEARAGVLQLEAEKSWDRLVNIDNKGRQQIVTRHRPFRAGWKRRGYV